MPVDQEGNLELVPDKARITTDMRHLQELAEAYDDPRRNINGLVSSLHEMLALARVTGDRKQEAYVLWRLGAVRNETSDYEEARQYLIQARDMFESLGLENYRVMAVLDLAHTSAETGALDAAIEYSREVA